VAGANLASIVYHFGGKEALHIAVAEHIVQQLSLKLGPALAILATADAISSPEKARDALDEVISIQADVLLGNAEAERWARFIVREQMQPTAAFDLIYDMMGGSHALATRLVAVALGRSEDEDVKVLVFTIIGQVLVFRVAQALVRRRLGWGTIGDRERAQIKRIIAANIKAILDGERGS
jgi:AcrR family transcriptional regulator